MTWKFGGGKKTGREKKRLATGTDREKDLIFDLNQIKFIFNDDKMSFN